LLYYWIYSCLKRSLPLLIQLLLLLMLAITCRRWVQCVSLWIWIHFCLEMRSQFLQRVRWRWIRRTRWTAFITKIYFTDLPTRLLLLIDRRENSLESRFIHRFRLMHRVSRLNIFVLVAVRLRSIRNKILFKIKMASLSSRVLD
jgi:hypothetical protein